MRPDIEREYAVRENLLRDRYNQLCMDLAREYDSKEKAINSRMLHSIVQLRQTLRRSLKNVSVQTDDSVDIAITKTKNFNLMSIVLSAGVPPDVVSKMRMLTR